MNPDDFSTSTAGRVLRTPKGYWAFIPKPLQPTINWSGPLISALGEAERNLGRLTSLADTLPFPHILVRAFIRREAVLSSRIEATRASLVDLYTYEVVQDSYFESSSDVR